MVTRLEGMVELTFYVKHALEFGISKREWKQGDYYGAALPTAIIHECALQRTEKKHSSCDLLMCALFLRQANVV